MDVIAVGDQLDPDIVAIEGGDRDPRRPVVCAGHPVEQVGRRHASGLEACEGPGQISARVPDRDPNAE